MSGRVRTCEHGGEAQVQRLVEKDGHTLSKSSAVVEEHWISIPHQSHGLR